MDTTHSGVAALSSGPESALASPERLLKCRWGFDPTSQSSMSRKTAVKVWMGLG